MSISENKINNIEEFLPSINCNYKCNEPLSKHTTLCIGGSADYFVEVATEDQLVSLLKFIKENSVKFFVIGGGSNILFSDEGFRGMVIKLSGDFCKYEIDKNMVACGGAISLAYLAEQTAEQGLSGLEYLSCIPGTVGGAVFGNAGVKKCSVSDIVDKIEIIYYSGNKRILTKKDINFEYRKSNLKDCIITKIFFVLKNADKNDILKTISQERKRRINSQPIGTKNAGCVFKNPESDSAGRLIDSLNLKNYSVGGIRISDVHANFFVNENNGNAQDMVELIEFVKAAVYKKYNIKLETEIRIIK